MLARTGAEGLFVDEAFALEKNFGDIGKDGGAVCVEAAVAERPPDIFEGEENFGLGDIFAAECFEIAGQFIGARSASATGSVGKAEAVMIGMSGEGAVASIRKGEATEGRAGEFDAFARHRESITKKYSIGK